MKEGGNIGQTLPRLPRSIKKFDKTVLEQKLTARRILCPAMFSYCLGEAPMASAGSVPLDLCTQQLGPLVTYAAYGWRLVRHIFMVAV